MEAIACDCGDFARLEQSSLQFVRELPVAALKRTDTRDHSTSRPSLSLQQHPLCAALAMTSGQRRECVRNDVVGGDAAMAAMYGPEHPCPDNEGTRFSASLRDCCDSVRLSRFRPWILLVRYYLTRNF